MLIYSTTKELQVIIYQFERTNTKNFLRSLLFSLSRFFCIWLWKNYDNEMIVKKITEMLFSSLFETKKYF